MGSPPSAARVSCSASSSYSAQRTCTRRSAPAPEGQFTCCRHCLENERSTIYYKCWAALPWWSINYLVTEVAWVVMLSLAFLKLSVCYCHWL